MPRIPLLDLDRLHAPIRQEILDAITQVVDSQRFILGEEVKELERRIAEYCGVRHAIACASGSDALYLALLAIGIQPGDEVVTTPFSFFATAGTIARAGAIPVFADIDPATFNLDPGDLRRVLESHPKVRAILPVHLYGGCADMDPILATASKHGCQVIEDGAQSIGAEYKGRRAQSLGDIGCISFFPSKNLGAMGDAGMLTTNNDELAAKLASLRVHGEDTKYHHRWVGINSRLDSMQAAILLVKFGYLDEWTRARQHNAGRYRELLAGCDGICLPAAASWQTRHIWHQFVVRAQERDRLRQYLSEQGIGSEVYYPTPLHLQPCFEYLGYREGDFPHAENAARQVLAIPVHSALDEGEIEDISSAIRSFYTKVVHS